jgi:hypothetical protein
MPIEEAFGESGWQKDRKTTTFAARIEKRKQAFALQSSQIARHRFDQEPRCADADRIDNFFALC